MAIVAIAATRPESDQSASASGPVASESYLMALQSDGMASVVIPGTSEARRSESESRSTSGEPLYAGVIRVLEIESDPRATLRAADRLALENGWTLTSQGKEEFHYERGFESVTATLTLHLDHTEGPDEHPHVVGNSMTVYLDASEDGTHHDHEG